MKLHNLQRSKGLKNKKKRVGRGNASGKGNYSAKGLKGQKARSGYSQKAFFEGGQTPLVQRIPKRRGFKRYFKLGQSFTVINIATLEKDDRIEAKATIDKNALKEFGYIKKDTPIKILGNGELTKTIQFADIERFSTTAREKIEKAGGSIIDVSA